MDGRDKMLKIMDVLRDGLPVEIGGLKVDVVLDQLTKKFINPETGEVVDEYSGFTDNALIFYLNPEKTVRVVVRPSGTQPKIKFYAALGNEVGLDKSQEEYEQIKKESDEMVYKILEDMISRAEGISGGGERFEIMG